MVCINKSHPEYQALKQKSGISEYVLDAYCQDFMDKYNRFPYLDELPKSNSENSFKETFKVNSNNGASLQLIQEITGKNSPDEINAFLNNQYRDLEIEVTPLKQKAFIHIEHRPSKYNVVKEYSKIDFPKSTNSVQLLNESIYKLGSLYGIKFKTVTAEDGVPNNVNAFVKDGDIYINTDVASFDAPLHEMLHMFVGSIRYTNPTLYNELVNTSEQLQNYSELVNTFENRTRGDINEELFIQEYSKYVVGEESLINNLPESMKYEIQYNVNRVLDSILFGEDSVANIPKNILYNSSLNQISQMVNSAINQPETLSSIVDTSRIVYNLKSDLLKEGRLKEYC